MESEEYEEIVINIIFLKDSKAINIITRYIIEELENMEEIDCNLN